MPTVSSNGTQTAVIGTEHTLYNPTTNHWFSGIIDLTNMASGDTTEIRVYLIAKTSGSYIQYFMQSFQNAQTSPLLHIPSLPSDIGWKLTLKQTAGTGRAYDWKVFEV
jgi:hypothetical protein